MINKLIDIISREARAFENFLMLLEEQQKSAEEGNSSLMAEIIEHQREEIIKSRILYNERKELLEKIKKDGQLLTSEIQRLVETIENTQSDRMIILQKLFTELDDKIQNGRQQNRQLLKQSKEYIYRSIKMLSEIYSPDWNSSISEAICRHEGCAAEEKVKSHHKLTLKSSHQPS